MNATYPITKKTGYACAHIASSSAEASTFHTSRMRLDKVAVGAEAESIMRDAHANYLHSIALPRIGDDYSDDEELEWDTLFAQPHVQAGLDRLEEEAMRQIVAGETEEGGFAVE